MTKSLDERQMVYLLLIKGFFCLKIVGQSAERRITVLERSSGLLRSLTKPTSLSSCLTLHRRHSWLRQVDVYQKHGRRPVRTTLHSKTNFTGN